MTFFKGYNTKTAELENEIPNITGLVTKINVSAKVIEIRNKIPNLADFAKRTKLGTKLSRAKTN